MGKETPRLPDEHTLKIMQSMFCALSLLQDNVGRITGRAPQAVGKASMVAKNCAPIKEATEHFVEVVITLAEELAGAELAFIRVIADATGVPMPDKESQQEALDIRKEYSERMELTNIVAVDLGGVMDIIRKIMSAKEGLNGRTEDHP